MESRFSGRTEENLELIPNKNFREKNICLCIINKIFKIQGYKIKPILINIMIESFEMFLIFKITFILIEYITFYIKNKIQKELSNIRVSRRAADIKNEKLLRKCIIYTNSIKHYNKSRKSSR